MGVKKIYGCVLLLLAICNHTAAQVKIICRCWGKRRYYYNCHRSGGNDFSWYANNLPNGIAANSITVNWIFNNKWHPELN